MANLLGDVPPPDSNANPSDLNRLALALLGLGEAEAAVDMLKNAIAATPDNVLLRGNLAYALKYDPRSDGPAIRRAAEDWAQCIDAPQTARPAPARHGKL